MTLELAAGVFSRYGREGVYPIQPGPLPDLRCGEKAARCVIVPYPQARRE